MAKAGLSYRGLAAEIRTIIPSSTLGHSYLGRIARGVERPSASVTAVIAQALKVEPERFSEFCLQAVLEALDERSSGGTAAREGWAELLDLASEHPGESEVLRTLREIYVAQADAEP